MGGAVSSGEDNEELVDNLVSADYLHTPEVERALRAVDRGDYYLAGMRNQAYRDTAWKHGNLHLSAPCIYAEVLENLDLQPGLSFLNLGSGLGYLSTVAGLILGRHGVNHGLELHEEVVDYARDHLRQFSATSHAVDMLDFCEPQMVVGNCLLIDPSFDSCYDRIYVGAAVPEEFKACVKNLIKIGGVIVMPCSDQLEKIRRLSETGYETKSILPVSFASLIEPSKSQKARGETALLPSCRPASLAELCRGELREVVRQRVYQETPSLVIRSDVLASKAECPQQPASAEGTSPNCLQSAGDAIASLAQSVRPHGRRSSLRHRNRRIVIPVFEAEREDGASRIRHRIVQIQAADISRDEDGNVQVSWSGPNGRGSDVEAGRDADIGASNSSRATEDTLTENQVGKHDDVVDVSMEDAESKAGTSDSHESQNFVFSQNPEAEDSVFPDSSLSKMDKSGNFMEFEESPEVTNKPSSCGTVGDNESGAISDLTCDSDSGLGLTGDGGMFIERGAPKESADCHIASSEMTQPVDSYSINGTHGSSFTANSEESSFESSCDALLQSQIEAMAGADKCIADVMGTGGDPDENERTLDIESKESNSIFESDSAEHLSSFNVKSNVVSPTSGNVAMESFMEENHFSNSASAIDKLINGNRDETMDIAGTEDSTAESASDPGLSRDSDPLPPNRRKFSVMEYPCFTDDEESDGSDRNQNDYSRKQSWKRNCCSAKLATIESDSPIQSDDEKGVDIVKKVCNTENRSLNNDEQGDSDTTDNEDDTEGGVIFDDELRPLNIVDILGGRLPFHPLGYGGGSHAHAQGDNQANDDNSGDGLSDHAIARAVRRHNRRVDRRYGATGSSQPSQRSSRRGPTRNVPVPPTSTALLGDGVSANDSTCDPDSQLSHDDEGDSDSEYERERREHQQRRQMAAESAADFTRRFRERIGLLPLPPVLRDYVAAAKLDHSGME